MRNLTIAAKKAALSYKSTLIDNGFDVTLSSGTVTLQLSEDNSKLTARPSVKAKLPQASNLSVTGQTNITSNSDETKVTDTSVSVGVDIISSAVLSYNPNKYFNSSHVLFFKFSVLNHHTVKTSISVFSKI